MRAVRKVVFPGAQMASAAATLIVWLLVGHLTQSESESVPITSYTYGVPLGLVSTMGLAYIVPNLFRETPVEDRHGPGPWSAATWTATAAAWAVSLAGLACVLVGYASEAFLDVGTILCVAGSLSLGILLAQVARSADNLRLTIIGTLTTPAVGACWYAAVLSTDNQPTQALIAASLMTLTSCVITGFLVPFCGPIVPLPRPPRRLLRRSLPLIPHLIAFGLVVQGIRFAASLSSAADLIDAHQIMLAVAAGLTLEASINSYVGPQIQTASDAAYPAVQRKANIAYAGTGLVAATTVACGFGLLTALHVVTKITPGVYLGMMTAVVAVAGYYSLSAQLMRRFSTGQLAIASSSALAVLVGLTILLDSRSIQELTFNFAVSTCTLTATTAVLSARKSVNKLDLIGIAPMALLGISSLFWMLLA